MKNSTTVKITGTADGRMIMQDSFWKDRLPHLFEPEAEREARADRGRARALRRAAARTDRLIEKLLARRDSALTEAARLEASAQGST